MNNNPKAFASPLAPVIENYLALKRGLGCQYNTECRVFRIVDRFLAVRTSDLTSQTFTEWFATLQNLTPGTRIEYLRIVRNLCCYRRRFQPESFVPDTQYLCRPREKFHPYIFTDLDVARLVSTAEALSPMVASPLRRETFRLAIVILYTAGLRCGELVRLTLSDYAPTEGVLQIRDSKFNKSRIVPLSADAVREIDRYLALRRNHRPTSPDSPLLWRPYRNGRAWTGDAFSQRMRDLFRRAGIRTSKGKLPRVHDFRHGFAIGALQRWYRAGVNVQSKLPFLAAYMGHASIVSTEYYLQFIEPLTSLASDRFASHYSAVLTAPVIMGGGQ